MVDAFPMPDLSEMLGDVYGAPEEPSQPAAPSSPGAPGWSDDEHLDKAFADWTPGPGADAPAAERGMFAQAPPAASPRLADDLAAALSEAVMAETDTDDIDVDDEVAHDEVARHAVAEIPAPTPVAEPVTTSVLAELEPEPEPEPAPIPVPVHKAGWQRSDDDILPTGKVAKGGVRLPRPSRAGKAPKASKPDAGPKKQRKSFGDLMKMEIGGKKKK
jgi:hypothetical protein